VPDLFRISVRGAGAAARQFDDLARAVQTELTNEIRGLGVFAAEVYVSAAPEDTGDLREAIRAVPYFRAARPRVTIRLGTYRGHRGDDAGDTTLSTADALRITREGHRTATIEPRRARALKVYPLGERNLGVYEFRRSVRGAHPVRDWTEAPARRVEEAAARSSRNLARRFETTRLA
jgi:hypothetical protein